MAALLNDPMTERTGLTPQYSGPDTNGMNGAASPMTQQMLGQGSNFMGMDGLGGDIDWVSTRAMMTIWEARTDWFYLQGAWDSYIQGTAGTGMEASMWPMNLDLGAMDATTPANGVNGNGNTFMGGAGTPGNTGNMM